VGIGVKEALEPPQPIIPRNIAQPRRTPQTFAILPNPFVMKLRRIKSIGVSGI